MLVEYSSIWFIQIVCNSQIWDNKLMAKIVLDLHDIFNKGLKIDTELNRVIVEATDKNITLVEIIPGKGSGQLKKHVLRFLAQPKIKRLYHRLEKDSKNHGRVFVHFRY
jgi:DNA-nicking Smr family endonuclease